MSLALGLRKTQGLLVELDEDMARSASPSTLPADTSSRVGPPRLTTTATLFCVSLNSRARLLYSDSLRLLVGIRARILVDSSAFVGYSFTWRQEVAL